MTNLFKKAAAFTDLHLGRKGNSKEHNEDCLNFIDWFCSTAQKNGCDVCIMLGDFHDHRATINVTTLNYSVKCLEKLSASFDKVYLISGNHDLFRLSSRELNSFPYAAHIDNLVIINEITEIGDVALIPWLVGDEWKQMKSLKAKYVFSHLELPNFYMNAQILMPDHGGLNSSNFPNQDYVFSGHFHKRQSQGNIHYIGNAFPHTFADTWDDERGMMMLEWGGKPEYQSWKDAPKFRTLTLSKLLEDPDRYLDRNTFAKITVDIDLSFEESNMLKETFQTTHNVRGISFIPPKNEEHSVEWDDGKVEFESVDKIVLTQLDAIESESINKNLLVEIYNSLEANAKH
jgi:DNA repair exonuclease SbcCD nuclease subunit